MTLFLDSTQRLHLHALLGMLECTSLYETRIVWQLMDRLMLDEAEKISLEFKIQGVNGNEAYYWNQAKSVPVREFEVSENETKQVQRALEPYLKQWKIPVKSRPWLEPLLSQLPEEWLTKLLQAMAESSEKPPAEVAAVQ